MNQHQHNTSESSEARLRRYLNELRQPMQTLILESDKLIKAELPKEHLARIRTIREVAGSLLFKTVNAIDLEEIVAGRVKFESEPFRIAPLFNLIEEFVSFKAALGGSEFIAFVDPSVPKVVYGDAFRLGQIIFNLVENSLNLTKEGGVLLFIEVESSSQDTITLRCSASDSAEGFGVDEELSFSSIEEAQEFMYKHFGHQGIGLATAFVLITQAGGRLWVRRRKKTGSAFHFTLPFQMEVTKTGLIKKPKPLEIGPELHSLHILAVDDQSTNRLLLKKLLEKGGHTVELAEDGIEALRKFKKDKYDIVLMDIQMPHMDGFEVARQMRIIEEQQPSKTPIIAVTACLFEKGVLEATDRGLDFVIEKPIRFDSLFKVIQWYSKGQTEGVPQL